MNTSKSLDETLKNFAGDCYSIQNDRDRGVYDQDQAFKNYKIAESRTAAAIVEAVEGLIGPDEPDIPMEAVQPDGSQMVKTNPVNQYKARLRQAIKEWQ